MAGQAGFEEVTKDMAVGALAYISVPLSQVGKLDVFSVYQMSGTQQQGRAFATIIERGNVRSVSDTDKSIFGVPADFTKES